MIKPGIYRVEMWNGRMGILQRIDLPDFTLPEYMDLFAEDLPSHLGGKLEVGESIEVKAVIEMEAIDRPRMPRRQRLLLELEKERRKLYGAKG